MSFSPSPCVPAGVRSIQEQRERWDRKRKRTGRELVQSEQRYCEKLDLITTVSLWLLWLIFLATVQIINHIETNNSMKAFSDRVQKCEGCMKAQVIYLISRSYTPLRLIVVFLKSLLYTWVSLDTITHSFPSVVSNFPKALSRFTLRRSFYSWMAWEHCSRSCICHRSCMRHNG